MVRPVNDRRWELLQEARPEVLQAFRSQGVIRVEFVSAFPQIDEFAVWLCTRTDEERDRLGIENPGLDQVQAILLKVGFSASQLSGLMTTAESQETVDRDYEGSWFYAIR